MKKTIVTMLVLAGSAMAETAEPVWTMTDNGDGTATYSTTITGGFNVSLSDFLAITDNESFTLQVEQTATSWANDYGTAIIGCGGEIYQHPNQDNQFRFYVGKTGTSNTGMHFEVNAWDYNSERVDNYSQSAAPATPSAVTPLTMGFVFEFVNVDDAPDGNDYFTLSPSEHSQVTWSPKTDGNVVRTYNFASLTNESSLAPLPADVVTTISLTKAIPEPATATLSLLALAALAAHRKRK